jgi:hypothetical protein
VSKLGVGVDATSVSTQGRGIARTQGETVRALATLERYDLIASVAGSVDLGVASTRVRRRPALVWEQVGLARAARGADAVLTWTDRLPLAGGGRFVIWLFEQPTHRIAQNQRVGFGTYQRASDRLTTCCGSGASAGRAVSWLGRTRRPVSWRSQCPSLSARGLFLRSLVLSPRGLRRKQMRRLVRTFASTGLARRRRAAADPT